MSIKIVAIYDNELCGKLLEEECYKSEIIISYEIQNENGIINKLSMDTIQNSNIVLFVTEKEVEEIAEIERFIDREYYEVLPQFVIENPANVISEITSDIN